MQNPNFLFQPKKVMSFEDVKQRALQWKKAIEALQNRWKYICVYDFVDKTYSLDVIVDEKEFGDPTTIGCSLGIFFFLYYYYWKEEEKKKKKKKN